MKGIFINCPNRDCKKMLMKNAYLRPGSYLTTKCYHCGAMVTIESEQGNIKLKCQPVDKFDLTDDEDDGIINLHL